MKQFSAFLFAAFVLSGIGFHTAQAADKSLFSTPQSDMNREQEERLQAQKQSGSGNSSAQENASDVYEYDKSYKPRYIATPSGENVAGRILPTGSYNMYFVHTPTAKPNEATLRLISPVSVSGCVKVMTPEVTQIRSGANLRIKIANTEARIDNTVRYAEFQCKVGRNYATADIVLDRDQLIADGVKQVVFESNRANDTYTVEVSHDEIALRPKSSTFFKPQRLSDRTDSLAYWFYPENTIVLYAPNAPAGTDLDTQIGQLAVDKGLKDVTAAVKDFYPPSQDGHTFYFVDESGARAKTLQGGQNVLFGTVAAPETFYGASGAYQKDTEVAVYARLPGNQD